jgi:HD-GYP domain-containing protein (c-di-GMP phosphodiesterase class II)
MSDSAPLRRCTKCSQYFPATLQFFYFQKYGKYQLTSHCKACMRKHGNEAYRADPRNKYKPYVSTPKRREQMRLVEARKRAANRDEYNAKARDRRKQNREKVNAQARERYKNNPEKKRRGGKEWRLAHPDSVKYNRKIRRDRKRNAIGYYRAADIRLLYKTQNGKCWWCNEKLPEHYHIDHRVPLSKSGTNWPENLCLACPKCNRSKGDNSAQASL